MGLVATVEQPTLVSLTENAAAKIRELMAEEPDGVNINLQCGSTRSFKETDR